jgi:hypothetical protein
MSLANSDQPGMLGSSRDTVVFSTYKHVCTQLSRHWWIAAQCYAVPTSCVPNLLTGPQLPVIAHEKIVT